MNRRNVRPAAALLSVHSVLSVASAAVVTVGLLGSIDHLATQPAPQALLARLAVPAAATASAAASSVAADARTHALQVVVSGKRAAQI